MRPRRATPAGASVVSGVPAIHTASTVVAKGEDLALLRKALGPGGRLTARARELALGIAEKRGSTVAQVVAEAVLEGPPSVPVHVIDRQWRLATVPLDRRAAIRMVAADGAVALDWSVILMRHDAADWTDVPARVILPGVVSADALRSAWVPWVYRDERYTRLVGAVERINRFGTVAVFDACGRLARTPVLAPRAREMVRDGRARNVGPNAIQLAVTLGEEALAPRAAGHVPRWLVDPDELRGRLAGPHAEATLDDIADWNDGVVESVRALMEQALTAPGRRHYPIGRRGMRARASRTRLTPMTPAAKRALRRAHKRLPRGPHDTAAAMAAAAVERHVAALSVPNGRGHADGAPMAEPGVRVAGPNAAAGRNVFVLDAAGRPLPIRLTRMDATWAVRTGRARWGLEWPGRVVRPATHAGVYVPAHVVLGVCARGVSSRAVLEARDMAPLRVALPAIRGGATVEVSLSEDGRNGEWVTRRQVELAGWPATDEDVEVIDVRRALRELGISHGRK